MTASVYHLFTFKKSSFRKYLLGFLGLCVANFASSQDYPRKLEWQLKSKTFTLAEKSISQPTFTNASHLEQFGLLPFYIERFPLTVPGEINVQVLNPVYSALTVNPDNASVAIIKEAIDVKADLSYYRKRPFAYISILPLRKNPASGSIERLESFTLRISVTPKPQKRSANAYASNSVLANGNWYKLAVSNEGIYKIDYNFIKTTLGIDPNGFNLNTLGVFGNGGGMVPDANSIARPDDLMENGTLMVDNNGNNKFDTEDYLLFYGQMPDQWNLNTANQTFEHTKNLYSDKTYYFLTTTNGTGKRAQTASSPGSANKTISDFDERYFHESDEENILRSGKEWLGDKMTTFNNTKSFSLNFPNLVTSSPINFKSSIAGKTNPPGSTIPITINNQPVLTQTEPGIAVSSYPNGYFPVTNSTNYNSSSDQLKIDYSFSDPTDLNGTAACYINYFELNLKRALTLSGNAMSFRNISSVGAGNISQFLINNATSSTKVWDITDLNDIREMSSSLSGSRLSFTTATDNLREFIAFNSNAGFSNPEFVGTVVNQNLHAIGQPDLVILTYDGFESPSNDLADFHRTKNNLTASVVKLSQVYNEFGSGKPDISAIRDFMRMLYDHAGGDTGLMPRYLLLMGDGSYDPKGRIAESNNFVPTYQSYQSVSVLSTYTSDDFFGLLDDNEGGDITNGSQQIDIGIGRLPVESETEAWDVVNKIKNYKYPVADASCVQINSNASWRNVITYIADDLDEGGSIFETYSDGLANTTRAQNRAYNYEKIYLDAYKQLSTPAGPRYPEVNTAILNRINAGCLIMNWVGHGGETNLAHERIFNMADIIPLANKEKLPLFITATCEFGRYDLPDRSAGEWLVVNGKGGGIAAITTLRLVYQSANETIATATFQNLFKNTEGRLPTLGEVIMDAKNAAAGGAENTRKFTLLGDPALTLNYPRYDIATTAVNNKPVSQDTMKALEKITVQGEVRDDNGNKMTSFNGVVYPLVYDKISTQSTLGNDESYIMNFQLYKNILYKGKASVTNGDFTFSFIVPKDINYQYGRGRISYYADNGNYLDAHGYNDSITIGGSADTFMADNTGPEMKIYMNDEKFVFGGTTNADPMLLVKLLDSTGINTVGNGIGHDITAVLDDNTQNKVVLNEYYESELDNYQKGVVKYPYSKLTDGRHTLKVKAWDIYNNSSEDYTEFVVASNAKLALTHVYNYPNPFTTHTQFMFEHNRCCDDLNISVQIYTVSGKLVKSIVQQEYSQGYRVNDIAWDGLDDYGDPIGKGVYVYKLNVRDSEGNSAHKFEKLVVLR